MASLKFTPRGVQFTQEFASGWLAEITLGAQDGRTVVQELRVYPGMLSEESPFEDEELLVGGPGGESSELPLSGFLTVKEAAVPEGGLTARVLRRVSLRPQTFGGGAVGIAGQIAAQYVGKSRRRRRRDVDVLQIARCYAEAGANGSRRQNADVARSLGLKMAQVRDAVHAARKRGFLTKAAKQGKPGGTLTQKAEILLIKRGPK